MYYFSFTYQKFATYLKSDTPEYFLPISTIQLPRIIVSLYILVTIVRNKVHGVAFFDTINTFPFLSVVPSGPDMTTQI